MADAELAGDAACRDEVLVIRGGARWIGMERVPVARKRAQLEPALLERSPEPREGVAVGAQLARVVVAGGDVTAGARLDLADSAGDRRVERRLP
jgi:hypothetical protein